MVIKITRIINLKYFCKDIVSEGIKTLFGFLPKGTVIGQIYIMDIDKDMICKYWSTWMLYIQDGQIYLMSIYCCVGIKKFLNVFGGPWAGLNKHHPDKNIMTIFVTISEYSMMTQTVF